MVEVQELINDILSVIFACSLDRKLVVKAWIMVVVN
jgi:hypothetical protein